MVARAVSLEVSRRVSSELQTKPKKPVVARLLTAGYKADTRRFQRVLVPAVTTVLSKAPISSSARLQTRLTNCAGRHGAPYPVKWLHGT